MLSPYSHQRRRTAIGPIGEGENLQNFQLFFDNCEIAKYLIKRDNSEKLQLRNGSLTELGKHCASCEKCKTAPIKANEEIVSLELNLFTRKELEKWRDRNAPKHELGEAIKLLLKYFEFAKKELKW